MCVKCNILYIQALIFRISRTTTSLFPVERFLERVFKDVLKERFTVSGLMMKTVLIEQYKLDVEFQFLRHMYLFYDDVLFGFYVGFFEKVRPY